PTGTSGINLSINTGGNLQLIEQVGVSKYTLDTRYYEEVTETWNEVSTNVRRSKADANGDIHLTLTGDQSPYCVLRFRPLHYDHSGTITFEDISTTAIYNNGADNTLKITHSPLTIIDHKYMWRDDYMLIGDKSTTPDDIAETMVADANFYENFRVDANTAGQEFVARLYFPNSVKERMSDKDENGQDLTFSFLFAGIGAEVIEPTGARDSYSNYYTVDEETGMVTVTKLISGTGTGTDPNKSYNGVNTNQAFVDIFLRTNEDVSTENFRITSGDDLLFYRYTLGEFSTRTGYIGGGGKVKYEIAYTDQNPTWVELVHGKTYFNSGNEDPSYDNIFGNSAGKLLSSGRNFYLKASFTDWTEGEKVNLTITTSGFRTEQGDKPTNSTLTVSPEDDTHLSYKEYTYHFNNLTLDANKSVTIKLKTEDQGIADYLQVDARTDISDDNTDRGAILSKSAFIMAAKAGGEPQEWELYYNNASDKEGTNKDIFDIGAPIGSVQMLDDKYPIQINNQNSVSFYVPYDGVDLTVWAADDPNTTNAGNYAIYKVSYNDSQQAIEEVMLHNNPSVSSTAELQKDTYTLGTAGLYRIQAIDSPAYLYYIGLKKVKTAGQLGTTSWTAKRLDNSTKANATWSGSFNDDAEYITLSAFAEKLTLTFPNITEVPFNMRLLGDDFRFFTPDGLVTELTGLEETDTLIIVPTNGGVLEHLDKIQLDGESDNYFYKQDITLKLRPYMKMTSNLNFDTFDTIQIWEEKNSRYEDYVHLQVGDELSFTFTYVDNSIETENVQFGLGEYGSNTSLTATAPEGWTKNNLYTINNPGAGDERTFNLKATSATTGTLAVVCGTSSCDVYSGDTLTGAFFLTNNYENLYPKIHITGVSITYDWGSYTDAEGQLPKDSVTGSGAEYTLPAKNFTLYKEGYTLTGWSDGTNTYNPGATLTVRSNVILTPVFTQNTVSLDDRTEEVTIKWDFQRNNGAPTINGWEGTDGHVWVAQATVTNGSTTRTIDVKMDVNTTNGKFANASWGNWCQLNNGTILTIPSCTGATVEMNAHNKISTTTINGETGYTAGNTITATVSGSDATTDIVIDDGSYYSYVQVTLPVVEKEVNIIPTTDSNPFDLEEMTLLYDTSKNQASAKGEKEPAYREGHLDYMANGDYAEYKVTNTENTAYRISFNTATPLENVTLTFTLYDEAGTQVWSGTSQALEKNSNSSDWSTQIPGQILTNYLQEGSYKLRITFNKAGSTTTANLYSVSFTPIEYKIGLGTWASSAIYENITVTNLDNNAVIYSSGSSLSSSNWNTSTGLYGTNDYVAYSSQLELEDLKADGNYDANGATAVLDKVIETNNYQITCRAKKTGGSEGFLILFNYADDQNRKWWNIGGWSNKIQTVETWTVGSYANNVTQWATDTDPKIVASNIWYDITIKVQNGEFTGSCVPASIGAPYRFDCTFDGTTVNRMNTPVSQDASAVWALDGSIGTPTLTGGAFSNNNMTYENFTQGSDNETVDGVKTDYVTFAPSTANTYTPITWSITPTTGLTFTPTRVSAKILRVGTDGGTVNVKVKNSDGKETTLASDIIPRRKGKNTVSGDTNEDPKHKDGNTVYDYIEYSVDASLATSNSFSFIIEVSIGSGKSVAISDVQIHGAVSGKLE
ncbi:MAG: hypothetical protein IJA00_07060, partial [Bacteroidaceae bacterium]|nr:hypothetical protein [Bacteroidaceae bacterium]